MSETQTQVTPAVAVVPGAPGGGPAATSWYSSAEPTVLGHMQTKGWDKLTPDQAALKAAHSHFELEKMRGVPEDQLLRLPKDASDEAGWNAVHARLGVPAKAEDYSFDAIKKADGTPLDKPFTDEVRQLAHELKLPQNQAVLFAQKLAARVETEAKNEQAVYEAELSKEKTTLKTNWGQNAPQNMVIAQNAARKLGVTDDAIKSLEGIVGYAKVMDMFLNIGQKIGEDTFVRNGAPQGNGVVTREQAMARLAIMEKDQVWAQKFSSGDAAAAREFDALTRIVAGIV